MAAVDFYRLKSPKVVGFIDEAFGQENRVCGYPWLGAWHTWNQCFTDIFVDFRSQNDLTECAGSFIDHRFEITNNDRLHLRPWCMERDFLPLDSSEKLAPSTSVLWKERQLETYKLNQRAKKLQFNPEHGKVIRKRCCATLCTWVDAKTGKSYRPSLLAKALIPTTRVARVDLSPRAPDR